MIPTIQRCVCLMTLYGLLGVMPACASMLPRKETEVVKRSGGSEKLEYDEDKRGNEIPDFSHAGYRGGGVKLPEVKVRETLSPKSKGDDTKRIQGAINKVARRKPDKRGFRGAVLLNRGTYRVKGTLKINDSGIVLRGEGQGEDGTVIKATGRGQRTIIEIAGTGSPRPTTARRHKIVDEYVPVGARSFRVDTTKGLKVGNKVTVFRPSTEKWIHKLKMDRIPPRDDGRTIKQWQPGSKDLKWDRVITKIKGARVTVDAPITNAIEKSYCNGTLYRYDFPGRIEKVGVEDLRGVSAYRHETDEDHAWDFITLDAVENAWVRNITAQHFGYSAVSVKRYAKWVTVTDSECLDPISKIIGSRRYSFSLTGQLTLVQRCYARNGRHDFVMHSHVPGPNVFLDCRAEEAHTDSGPHHRWATGTLYDNVSSPDGSIRVRNSGNEGSGHGWTGAQIVFWNCRAVLIECHNPPTATNWAVGCIARDRRGDGNWDSFGRLVKPASLYLSQLEARKGAKAVENISEGKPYTLTSGLPSGLESILSGFGDMSTLWELPFD